MQDFKSQKIKTVIKNLLKKKGITYEELAEQMECSVPTIKRILGPEELTLNRLLALCEIVDIDLAELEALSGAVEKEDEQYTEAQQQFLAKNKSYFAYLMKIFKGDTPKQIAEEYNLSPRSTDKYLIGLEKHELIRVTGKQKVKPAFKGVPHLGRGALAKVYFESLINAGAKFFIDLIHESFQNNFKKEDDRIKAKYSMYVAKISKLSYESWVKEHTKATQELMRISTYEEKTMDASQLMSMVVMEANCLVDNKHPGIVTINNVFGDIPNL